MSETHTIRLVQHSPTAPPAAAARVTRLLELSLLADQIAERLFEASLRQSGIDARVTFLGLSPVVRDTFRRRAELAILAIDPTAALEAAAELQVRRPFVSITELLEQFDEALLAVGRGRGSVQ